MGDLPIPPHRRHDDLVSYRDMVDYFVRQEAEFHSLRAEGLMVINSQMEKIEIRAEKALDRMEEAVKEIKEACSKGIDEVKADFIGHETWHRNVLQGIIDRGQQGRLAVIAIIVSIVGICVSSGVAILALLVHR